MRIPTSTAKASPSTPFEPPPAEPVQGNDRRQRRGRRIDQPVAHQNGQYRALRIGAQMEGHLRPFAARIGQGPEFRVVDGIEAHSTTEMTADNRMRNIKTIMSIRPIEAKKVRNNDVTGKKWICVDQFEALGPELQDCRCREKTTRTGPSDHHHPLPYYT